MTKKKLPIGIQTFEKLRDPEQNYVYIDKTKEAYQLITESEVGFLSRPRRFGKSLFLDTLSDIFKGRKELFEGLYIHDKWDWETTYPVIRVDFTGGGYTSKEKLDATLQYVIRLNCENYDIDLTAIQSVNAGEMLGSLIRELHRRFNQKVVLLIDEYDKPILDNIDHTKREMAQIAREALREFYSSIKANGQYLRFVFLTGVSKFSKLNLFSGLNNIDDISLNREYATITGYTQHDVETHFADYLEGVDLEKVKKWYNGYNYFGEPIYNPFDILLFLSKGCEFRNYWWQTGNPAFLIDVLKQGDYYLPNLEDVRVSEEILNSFDIEYIDFVALLWQTGYLTFDKKIQRLDDVVYKMKLPNLEVQKSLYALFFNYLTNRMYKTLNPATKVIDAFLEHDFQTLHQEIKSLFAAIPYENYVNNNIATYEGYYASVIFAFISSLGFVVKAEDSTNRGRIDMTILGIDAIYVIEFKVDMPAEAAIKQIKERRYYEKYETEGKKIFAIGMHFDSKERNVVEFAVEEID